MPAIIFPPLRLYVDLPRPTLRHRLRWFVFGDLWTPFLKFTSRMAGRNGKPFLNGKPLNAETQDMDAAGLFSVLGGGGSGASRPTRSTARPAPSSAPTGTT